MTPSEILSLLRVARPAPPYGARRLARCYSIEDVAKVARRRLPLGSRAYLDGGGEGEFTLRRNRAAFDELEFLPEEPRPNVIVFDVNETLSDMAPMASRFTEVGAPSPLARVWFAVLLRDGFALTAAGDKEPFARLARGALEAVLTGVALNRPAGEAADYILSGFSDLGLHPDVPEGVHLLAEGGLRLVTLSNGSADVADRLLTTAGIHSEFEALLSVEDAPAWKPASAAYAYAARACAVPIGQMLLVAVHPWDIHGAHQAGMRTGWISRGLAPYPGHFAAPDLQAPDLGTLARRILS